MSAPLLAHDASAPPLTHSGPFGGGFIQGPQSVEAGCALCTLTRRRKKKRVRADGIHGSKHYCRIAKEISRQRLYPDDYPDDLIACFFHSFLKSALVIAPLTPTCTKRDVLLTVELKLLLLSYFQQRCWRSRAPFVLCVCSASCNHVFVSYDLLSMYQQYLLCSIILLILPYLVDHAGRR